MSWDELAELYEYEFEELSLEELNDASEFEDQRDFEGRYFYFLGEFE